LLFEFDTEKVLKEYLDGEAFHQTVWSIMPMVAMSLIEIPGERRKLITGGCSPSAHFNSNPEGLTTL
jgi:hypothetical protein